MSDIRVKVGQDNLKVRVGQQNTVKVVSGISGLLPNVENSFNVIGGIASVTQLYVSGITSLTELYVSGISTFVGIATFSNDVYIGGDLYIQDDLKFDEFTARNANITGILSVANAFYYGQYNDGGVAYFDSTGLMVSTGSTSNAINYTNYILTTNNSGITTWSSTIDGGEY
jgi:hypothetical protein